MGFLALKDKLLNAKLHNIATFSNLVKILYMLSQNLVKFLLEIKLLCQGQYFPHYYKSIGIISIAEGQVTPK